MTRVIVIGAGFGGLTAAAELAKAGMDVTVLEAHNLPGGCASTFHHQGFQFDTGATLAGGFAPGAPMDLIGSHFGIQWEVYNASRAMVVHLPDGQSITRWSDHDLWKAERINKFGESASRFWDWQEHTADLLYDLASRLPAWPPQTMSDVVDLLRIGSRWVIDNRSVDQDIDYNSLFKDAFRPIYHHLKDPSTALKHFIDGQLLIASQTTSNHANALYGAVALDLPRRGVVDVAGGMVTLARQLVNVINDFGGSIHFKQEVTDVSRSNDSGFRVLTRKKHEFIADILIFNLPPWNINKLTGSIKIKNLRSMPNLPDDAWSAFTLYVGIKSHIIPQNFAAHHQLLSGKNLGEGDSIFMSISSERDPGRAPSGYRALTISTHTRLGNWWRLFSKEKDLYEERKEIYTQKILNNAEMILPGLRENVSMILPGTPITIQRFTRRDMGWVGGFPQTGLFSVWGPRLDRNIWMVGDTIFPGQSIPAASLGGIRVARKVIAEHRKQYILENSRPIYNP